jgi:hypothetical protein
LGLGLTFIQVDEYGLAIVLFVASAIVLFSKAVHWGGFPGKTIVTHFVRVLCILIAICSVPAFLIWTQAKKGDRAWTSFHISGRRRSNAKLANSATPTNDSSRAFGPPRGMSSTTHPAPPRRTPRKDTSPAKKSTLTEGTYKSAQGQNQQQTIGPEVQLLERAVEDVRSCHSFQEASRKRFQMAMRRIEEIISTANMTEQSKTSFQQWQMQILHEGDMKLYSQVYKQEFMEVRRLLVLKVPDAAEPSEDYERPGNMGGVTGICFDLSNITEAYIGRQYEEGRIGLEDGRRYLGRLRPALPAK